MCVNDAPGGASHLITEGGERKQARSLTNISVNVDVSLGVVLCSGSAGSSESSIRALWSGPHPGAHVTLHAPPPDPPRPMIDARRDKTPAVRQPLLPLRYNGETRTHPSEQTYRICAVITDSVALDKSRRILPRVYSPKGKTCIEYHFAHGFDGVGS